MTHAESIPIGDTKYLTHEDVMQWNGIIERLPHTTIASHVYDAMQLSGKKAAVVGPWWLPHDMLGLQLASSVGPNGHVYSIDPQGDSTRWVRNPETRGLGNSDVYTRQIQTLVSLGLPLAPFTWLGPESSFAHIPQVAGTFDIIADHATLEFVAKRNSPGYLRRGAQSIVNALPIGGLWVHHASTGKFLDCIVDDWSDQMAMDWWSEALGVRIVRHRVLEDSYHIPVPDHAIESMKWSNQIAFLLPNTIPKGLTTLSQEGLYVHESSITYKRYWMFVIQKIRA